MDKVKRILAAAVALIFVLVLTACGGDDSADNEETASDPTPCYVSESMKIGDKELGADDLKKMGIEDISEMFCVYLADDGKAAIAGENGALSGKWKEEDGKITLKAVQDGKTEKIFLERQDDDTLIASEEGSGSEAQIILKRTDEIPKVFSKDIMLFFDVDYSAGQTDRMNTVALGGAYFFDGDDIYGHFFDKDLNACLGKATVKEGTELKDQQVLDENCMPTSVVLDGDYIYYCRQDLDDNEKYTLSRVKKDGGDAETLYEGECDDIAVRDGKLYYSDADHHYVRADLDGGNSETVLDKEVYYCYWIDDNWLIYQDDADDETLHLYFAPVGGDKKITEVRSLCPVIDGSSLWYVRDEDGEGKDYRLAKLDLKTLKEKAGESKWPDGALEVLEEYIYMGSYNGNPNAGVAKKTWRYGEDVDIVDWEEYPWTENKAIGNESQYRIEWHNEGNGVQVWFYNGDTGQRVSFK